MVSPWVERGLLLAGLILPGVVANLGTACLRKWCTTMTFSARTLLVPAAAALLLGVSAAHAGVLVGTLAATPNPNSSNDSRLWFGGYPANVTDASSVQLFANITANSEASDGFKFGGSIDSDPHIEIIERITNSSTTTWTAYTVTVVPDSNSTVSNLAALFPGPPDFGVTSSNFTTASTTGNSLTFSGGAVTPGQTVVLDFAYDISLINNSFPGNFSYAIVNSPTPEPTTLGVLSVAALLLVKRRRAL